MQDIKDLTLEELGENNLRKLYDFCIPEELRKRKLLSIIELEKAGLISLPLRQLE